MSEFESSVMEWAFAALLFAVAAAFLITSGAVG